MDSNNKILIATSNSSLYFKADGHITANLCFPLRDMIQKKISLFSCPFDVYFDLSETKYMDSTFLGILVGIEKKINSIFERHLFVLNPNEISIKLLKNMGLDRFLRIINATPPENLNYEEFNEDTIIDEIEKCRIVLNSHKDLSALNEDNKNRFKSLQEVLEQQVKDK